MAVVVELLATAALGFFKKAPKAPPPPPPGFLDAMSAPMLLSASLIATVVVLIVGSYLLAEPAPASSGKAQAAASASGRAPPATAVIPPTPRAKSDPRFAAFERKMRAEGLSSAAIDAFRYTYGVLVSGESTMIPEEAIKPVDSLPTLASLGVAEDPSLLSKTVMLKLNGGLGTGMGLAMAKSLLVVKGQDTFLDLIAKQVQATKSTFGQDLAFMLMNSFSTSKDTLEHLSKYAFLPKAADLEFVQNKAPKVNAADLTPASYPEDRSHEWCPPGHGDLYPAMLGSGTLAALRAKGLRYMFVSNSDNLGATMDLKLLTHFARSGAPFMMEVAERTEADKKGGHLARDAKTGGLLLRESAQCPEADEKAFQDTKKYKFFNTNNLWVDLDALQAQFDKHGGLLPLPVIKNSKTVNPRDKKSAKVIQLETAMGSAISCFEGAIAVCIPRTRFAPVKTCGDLLALRSDAYVLTKDKRIELAPERKGVPPTIKLDDGYKFVDQLDEAFPHGAPSLIKCKKLVVEGPVVFDKGVVIKGSVVIKNASGKALRLPKGVYEDRTVDGKPLYDGAAMKARYEC